MTALRRPFTNAAIFRESNSTHAGFTLLEVLLALSLSVVLIGGAAQLINVQMKAISRVRLASERDQIARAVLNRICEDLRATVYIAPASSTATTTPATTPASGSSGSTTPGQTGGSGTSGQTGGQTSGQSTDPAQPTVASAQVTEVVTMPPGLYGKLDQLSIDVSHIPRPDEISIEAPTGDLRTVTYAIGSAGNYPFPGLIRNSAPRSADVDPGELVTMVNTSADMLAPEVAGIEFQYFDGTDWLPEWDSSVNGSVPLAVKVAFAVRSRDRNSPEFGQPVRGSLFASDSNWPAEAIHRVTVRLPAGKAPTTTAESTSTTSSTPSTTPPATGS